MKAFARFGTQASLTALVVAVWAQPVAAVQAQTASPPQTAVGAETPNSRNVGSTPEEAEAATATRGVSQQTGRDTVQTAAEAAEAPDADIIVTGFRGSIQSSLDEKRQSDLQLDVINAEDIADFPDANLAESLQRLPGVSVDRDNGEGRQITVRGLGGDFNRTRLNGLEALSTAGSNDSGTSPNRSRSFDYNTFASELFSSLKVQKTPSAETDEGSLGATIDLETGKPFDYKGTRFALSGEGSYNENSRKANPRIAGLVSTRFASGGRMGVLLSGAYNKTENIIDQYSRQPGQSDLLYRSTQFLGEGDPQRAGFSVPTNVTLPYANPDALAAQTGSNPEAYAKFYPGAPYNTPGRFDDSQIRIPALPTLSRQIVRNERIGLTGSYQWDVTDRTRVTVDGLYSRFKNFSQFNQLSPVGLNRNNTNAAYNNATGRIAPTAARATYPGLCTPAAGNPLVPEQDCGGSLYGTTPAFGTALNQAGTVSPSVLGNAAVTPGGVTPTNANIFSVNPNNLDPYDYYNNPNSVGYIASGNNLAYRGALIGRPGVDVLDANVNNGIADYLVLRNVDARSAVDQSEYTTTFWQGSYRIDQEFTDNFKMAGIYGRSKSVNRQTGLLVEFNRMDSPENFVFDEREGGGMPRVDFGFDVTDPKNWQIVKGFSAMRHYRRYVRNEYEGAKVDFDWQINDRFNLAFGGTIRRFDFETTAAERNIDTLNPTLLEARSTTEANSRVVGFGRGLDVPAGTVTSFLVPDLDKINDLVGFACDCINKFGDFRLTTRRNGGQNGYSVSEKDSAIYVQADFNGEIFGNPLRGNVGTRIARTEVRSTGTSQAGRPIVGTNDYYDYLPSMNLVYQPTRKLYLRFGASKVMARPLLGNLAPTITSIAVPSNGDNVGASFTIGNPRLAPFRSTNLDGSIEWYFSRSSLLSIAGFVKNIESFPQTVLFTGQLSQFVDPATVAAIRAQYTNVNQLAYIDANGPFTARQYRDAPGGYLRGIEANFQQNLTFLPGPLRNLGVLVNYTHITSQLNYILDPGTATRPQTIGKGPFIGVSPNAINATLFYEVSKFRARVSVAQRASYVQQYPIASGSCSPGLLTPGTGRPPTTNPTTVTETVDCNAPLINDFVYSRSTTNVDASVSLNLFKSFSLTLEGLNLTDQKSNRYAYQGQEAVTQYASAGRIYRVGARLSF